MNTNTSFPEHSQAIPAARDPFRCADASDNSGTDKPDTEIKDAAAGLVQISALTSRFAVLEIEGDDALTFMQGQFTQDVRQVTPHQAMFSAWCSAKGRMLASFLLLAAADTRFLLILPRDQLAFMQQRLALYVLRSKVRLAESHGQLLGVSGQNAAALLTPLFSTLPTRDLEVTRSDDARIIRLPDDRYLLLLAPDCLHVQKTLEGQAPLVKPSVWDWLDIRAGLPWITAATREAFVPQMADFEKLGVSFNKGCYTGQEIVARARYLGKIKRHLYRVRGHIAFAPGEKTLYSPASDQPGEAAGEIISAAPDPESGYIALAVLHEVGANDLHHGSCSGPRLSAEPVYPLADAS